MVMPDDGDDRAALAECRTLLQESRHRLRNNLQLLASLFSIQADQAGSSEVAAVMAAMERRIQAMAQVQSALYVTQPVRAVDVAEYLTGLLVALARAHDRPEIVQERAIAVGELDVDRAMACGLVVSELVTNSYLHAFPPGRAGVIRIQFQRIDAHYVLRVADSGVGLPADSVEGERGMVGLTIVQAFTRRLRGHMATERGPGVSVTISFPVDPAASGAAATAAASGPSAP